MASAHDSATISFMSGTRGAGRWRWFSPRSLAVLTGTLGIATLASLWASDTNHPVSAALLFVMAVLINGSMGGLAQGIVAAVYASMVYTTFIRFPVYLHGLNAIDDIFPVFAVTLTALLSGAVSGKLRDRMLEADQARRNLTGLFSYSNALQRALSLEQIAQALRGAVPEGRALESILGQVQDEPGLRDLEKWRQAVDDRPGQKIARADGGASGGDLLGDADERGIASLTIMAIERCTLLEEHATAQAVINSERMKTALLSSLSHDLRTPIAAISATAGTLKSYGGVIDDSGRADMLETILEQCARLDAFTGKLLSLGRLEAGLTADRLETVDVEEVLGSVIAAARSAFPQRQIQRRIAPEPLLTRASPVLLEQALFNVLENAVRYSAADTDVSVVLERAGEMVAITISDQGCGIAPADLPHIFERFYRGDNGAGQVGHGLGLAITKTFLDLIGGRIDVTSPAAEGKGTQVRIQLPRIAVDVSEEPND